MIRRFLMLSHCSISEHPSPWYWPSDNGVCWLILGNVSAIMVHYMYCPLMGDFKIRPYLGIPQWILARTCALPLDRSAAWCTVRNMQNWWNRNRVYQNGIPELFHRSRSGRWCERNREVTNMASNTIYQCSDCGKCFLTMEYVKRHECEAENRKTEECFTHKYYAVDIQRWYASYSS